MKKLLTLLLMGLGITILSGCEGDEVFIADGIMSVVYENIRYEGTSVFADIFVTNGLESDQFVGFAEFDIQTSDEALYIAGAGFDLNITIPKGGYYEFELEFGSEFVFLYLSDIEENGYSLEDLELLFWVEE